MVDIRTNYTINGIHEITVYVEGDVMRIPKHGDRMIETFCGLTTYVVCEVKATRFCVVPEKNVGPRLWYTFDQIGQPGFIDYVNPEFGHNGPEVW